MANFFVFSSPLQCFFASLVSKQVDGKNYGVYYNYNKSFKHLYSKIFAVTGAKFEDITLLSEFRIDKMKRDDLLFLGNRYYPDEIKLFFRALNRVGEVSLYEEGSNIYLPHHFNAPFLNDTSKILKFKNLIKRAIGLSPSHVYLKQFDKVYTSFSLKSCNPGQNKIISFINAEEAKPENLTAKECLFLSQTLAIDGFLDKDLFNNWIIAIVQELAQKFDVIYFKPHPRDDQETLNKILTLFPNEVRLLPEEFRELPAEIFLLQCPDIEVVGFFTSTLMYHSSLIGGQSMQLIDRLVADFPTNKKLIRLRESLDDMFKTHNIKAIK